jgi:hypothetical protein
MKRDDYILGGHHFWVHFWCGFVVGAGLGAWIGSRWFDGRLAFVASTVGIAFIWAYCCGRWGESAWGFLGKFFSWWWP